MAKNIMYTVRNANGEESAKFILDIIRKTVISDTLTEMTKEHDFLERMYENMEGLMFSDADTAEKKLYNKFAKLVAEYANLVTRPGLDNLNDYDRLLTTIMLHKTSRKYSITLTKDEANDFYKVACDYFENGRMSTVRDHLRTLVNRMNNMSDGEYFAPVAVKRSDVSDDVARHFLAAFSNGAKKNDKKAEYNYSVTESSRKISLAVTELLAVII